MDKLLLTFTNIAKIHKLRYWLDSSSLLDAVYYKKTTAENINLCILDLDEWIIPQMRYHLTQDGFDVQVLTGGYRGDGSAELDRSIDNGDTWHEVFIIQGNFDEQRNTIMVLAANKDGIVLGCVENRKKINTHFPTYVYSYGIS